jgi:nicotinate phosphoribosyltransferase
MDRTATPLLTDLYALTMLQAYFEHGFDETAVFELFVRRLPPSRNFLMAAGLEQAVAYLEALRFDPQELDWLSRSGRFSKPFLASLESLRFTGDVQAMPEGTLFFPDEPILRVVAPIREAQLVEARLMNLVHFQTVVASKAARCVLAAPHRLLVDFGLRRAHGAEAALLAARAMYLAGFGGTSNVLAGRQFGIPLYGTMAHSFVQAHGSEAVAFEHFARSFPAGNAMLIDTYDTEAAARLLVSMSARLAQEGIALDAVRIDSGDLAEHACRVRGILDEGGLRATRIFASGNLDEHRLQALVAAGAPIDGFGVGTRVDTSADAPYLDCAYKLQEYAGRPTRKRSEGKATWPGRKQVYRRCEHDVFAGDVLTLESAGAPAQAAPLLMPVIRSGCRVSPPVELAQARAHAASQMRQLPPALRTLAPAPAYRVTIGDELVVLRDRVDVQAGSSGGDGGAPAR